MQFHRVFRAADHTELIELYRAGRPTRRAECTATVPAMASTWVHARQHGAVQVPMCGARDGGGLGGAVKLVNSAHPIRHSGIGMTGRIFLQVLGGVITYMVLTRKCGHRSVPHMLPQRGEYIDAALH